MQSNIGLSASSILKAHHYVKNLKGGNSMNKTFKRFIAVVTCASMTVASMFSMSVSAATTTTRTIDNDSIADGYGNENSGFSYIKNVSSLANGDARYSSSSSSSNYYSWKYPSMSSKSTTQYATIKVGAYLSYSSWTDTAATYYVQYNFYSDCKIGTINQNKAPNGYSYIEAKDIHTLNADGGHYSANAYLYPSGNANQTTGADEIKVTLSY